MSSWLRPFVFRPYPGLLLELFSLRSCVCSLPTGSILWRTNSDEVSSIPLCASLLGVPSKTWSLNPASQHFPTWFSSRVHCLSSLIHFRLICIELCLEKLIQAADSAPLFRVCAFRVLLRFLPGPSTPAQHRHVFNLCLCSVGAEKEVLGALPGSILHLPVSSCFL